MARRKKMKGDQEDDTLSMMHSRVDVLLVAFDILDTTLLHAIETLRHKMPDLSYHRDSPATAKAVYQLYLETPLSEQPAFLGSIEMRKTQPEATEVVIRRVATGARALPFEEVVNQWKTYIDFDKIITRAVMDRSKDQTGTAGQKNPPSNPEGELLPPVNLDRLKRVKELSMIPLTIKQIAMRLAVSESTVKRDRKILNLKRRKK